MNILAFDTCFDSCSAAAGRGLRSLTPSISSAFEPMVGGQAERLLPMIDSVMLKAGLNFQDLDRIVVTSGPGTFTGSRIGVSAARALALASGVPIVSLTSLELMALSSLVSSSPGDTFAIATDARRGEVYLQIFERTGKPISTAAALLISDAAVALGAGRSVVAGSGAEAVAEAGRLTGAEVIPILFDLLPDALDVLFASVTYQTRPTVEPLYLRPPDAKPPVAILKPRIAS